MRVRRPPGPALASAAAGTTLLLGLALRRDKVIAPVWIGALLLMCLASAAATPGLYPDASARMRAAEALNASPAIVALYGPILDVGSVGELAMTKLTVLYAVFVAILFITLVRRHTRVEEESGRTELVAGTGIGREAPLAAAVLEGVVLAAALGGLTAIVNALSGLEVRGSVAFGAMWAGTALVAVGIGVVSSQLSASARTCAAWAAAILGAFYVLRAVGDTGPHALSWTTPLGWNTQLRAYSDPRWWVLALYPLVAAGLLLVGGFLRSRRDLGSGLVAPRRGPASGSPRLRGSLSLTLRVHASTIVLWSAAAAVLGALFGMIAPGVGDLLDSELARTVIDELGGALLAALLSVLAVVVTYFASAVISHAGRDEDDSRTELVLATAVGRLQWFLATVVIAALGVLWLLLVVGAAMWAGHASAGGPQVGNILVAALAWAPATWVVTSLSALCLAARSGWAAAAWAWPAGFLVLTLIVDLLDLPGWVGNLSPYAHVPALPAADWSWSAELGLVAVSAALVALAARLFTRRDLR